MVFVFCLSDIILNDYQQEGDWLQSQCSNTSGNFTSSKLATQISCRQNTYRIFSSRMSHKLPIVILILRQSLELSNITGLRRIIKI